MVCGWRYQKKKKKKKKQRSPTRYESGHRCGLHCPEVAADTAREASLGMAVRGTPAGGRPTYVAADDTPTVTIHAPEWSQHPSGGRVVTFSLGDEAPIAPKLKPRATPEGHDEGGVSRFRTTCDTPLADHQSTRSVAPACKGRNCRCPSDVPSEKSFNGFSASSSSRDVLGDVDMGDQAIPPQKRVRSCMLHNIRMDTRNFVRSGGQNSNQQRERVPMLRKTLRTLPPMK